MLRSAASPLDDVAEERDTVSDLTGTPSSSPVSTARSQSHAHARQHSRIHGRNLSAFFPRPGQRAEGYGGIYDDPHASPFSPGVSDIPRTTVAAPSSPSKGAAGRRGHHHRHSVSHNLFPFLDPASPARLTPQEALSKPPPEQLPAPSSSFHQRYGRLPRPVQLVAYAALYLPPASQVALIVAILQLVLGSSLWVQGQSGESLSVTGLGYLVVFDGLGTLSGVLLDRGGGFERLSEMLGQRAHSSLRKPFGSSRLITLSHFSQAIYLLFSAVYVCKESVEHVLLLHGPEDADGAHGAGHGGVGHGEGRAVSPSAVEGRSVFGLSRYPAHTLTNFCACSITFPLIILSLSALLALLSAAFFHTHAGLSRSIRPTILSRSPRPDERPSLLHRLTNPFTLTVAVFGAALFGAATVLLQTSPPPHSAEAKALQQALHDIENLPLVSSLETPHAWQLLASPLTSPSTDGNTPQTVVTLTVLVKRDTSDKDLLEITKFAQERCRTSGGGNKAGRDVTVAVKRV
ncbi:SPOSA6832_05083 [Sporobolomyces salmonicolor]|uniref:SPOSA6832_05083-mRNA-1:cds n=1 Tax=Sporidiobolus salmonicolor TaxID=5005 RepID=A0A0D6EUB5_SPOSA|nr:SPOSA6832_05083 [Sporobolomyces salmonicolor]